MACIECGYALSLVYEGPARAYILFQQLL